MTDIINLHDTLPLPPQPAGSAPALTATLVQDEQRIGFWPQYFGSIPQWIILEPTVFAWMDRFCADYNGGIWNFIRSATVVRLWPRKRRTMNRGRCSTL